MMISQRSGAIRRMAVRMAIAAVLVAGGWVAGRAQSAAPDFEIIVDAPGGETTVTCERGCDLAWVERGVNPNAKPIPTFKFSCSAGRCSSFKIGGWVR